MIQFEEMWLRRFWWVFPAIGFPLGCLLDGVLWAAVTLDRTLLPGSLSGWITAKGLTLGCGLSAIPLIWWAGIKIERHWGAQLRRCAVAPAGALLVFVIAELLLRSPYGQSLLWQSVRARAAENYFAREVALFRLDHAMRRDVAPGVVVAGSSQMLHALDAKRLSERLKLPVYRRAVAGMFPVELCAAAEFLDFHPQNKLLLMWSGFDLGGRDRIYPDAVRPLATPSGVSLLRQAADLTFRLRHWRFFVDMQVAAGTDWWRSRDFLRLVLDRPMGARLSGVSDRPTMQSDDAQRAAYLALGKDPALVNYSMRVIEQFWKRMSPRFAEIVVVEGQLNPAYPGDDADRLHERARALGQRAEAAGWIRYVPLAAQEPAIEPEDWLDMAHVNDSGRARYTELFARVINPSAVTQNHK